MAFGQNNNNNNNRQNYARTDRFGNTYELKFARQQFDKEGHAVEAYKTYVEIGGKLYKIEASHADKTKEDKKTGEEINGMWIKVTKTEKRAQSNVRL